MNHRLSSVGMPAGSIDYADEGSGPPVVLLHGLFMDHTLWDQVMPLLPSGFRYLRPVLPLGAHRRAMNSDADLRMPGMVNLVADFLDALDLDARVVRVDDGKLVEPLGMYGYDAWS